MIRISLKCVLVTLLWTVTEIMVSACLFIWHFCHPVYLLVLFQNLFSPSCEHPAQRISALKSTNCRFSVIFHKYCCYMKQGGIITIWLYKILRDICYWCVKIPQCGDMEHGLEYITLYVKKTYGIFGGLFWSPTGSRPATWGTCIYQSPIKACTYIVIFFIK